MPPTVAPIRSVLWLLVVVLSVSSARAWAQAYDGARREEVDAGVHTPVLTKAPELVHFVEAVFPPEAAAAGKTASVEMLITIDEKGQVSDAQVVKPVGDGFDEAALAAVRQFQFSPAEVDGAPAPIQIQYVYNFVLQPPKVEESAPPPPPQATLTGQLLARGSRSRVDGATVRCGDDPEAPEALSDAEGHFTLKVTPGVCDVRVVANDYHLFTTKETLAPGETTEVIFYLLPKAPGYETVVRGVREKKEVVRRTLERQELQKVPGTFGDPIRVIQNLPGVARAPFISGQLIVRGAAPDQTLTYFDGVQVPLLYHLGGGPSVLNAEFIDKVDFYPGGFSSRYGRAVGGVVDVSTRKGASDTLHGSAKVDLLDSGFFLEAPVTDGISVAGAARRSYVDVLLPLVLPEDPEGGTLLVLPRYWDYQVRMDFGAKRGSEPGPGGRHSGYVMAFGSDDLLNVVATGGGRNRDVTVDTRTLFHRVTGNWTYRLGNLTSVFTPYGGYDLARFGFGETKLDANVWSLGGREDLSLELTSWLTARAGADARFEHTVAGGKLPVLGGIQYPAFPGSEPKAEMQELKRVANAFDGGLYGELDLKFGLVTLTPGVRATYARIYGQDRFVADPRLWARYQPTERTAVKGSLGLYSQPPNTFNLEPAPLGNPALTHERAFQTSLGVEQQLTEALSVDLTGYYNRRYDLVVSPGETVQNDDGTLTRYQYGNRGLGRAYGMEIMLRHAVTRNFFGWIAYTLNRSEQRRVGGNDYRLTTWDQTHILTAVASYRLPYGFELGARMRYVTGRPTTPLQHVFDIYNVDRNGFSGSYGEINSIRYKPFHQLDLRLEKSWLFQSWTLAAYIDVQNVYNASNVEATFTDYRFREQFEVPGIPILPVLGIKGSF
ncbi:TonB family protein [Vitiosangium sp. GDMCC 1.1324]|uniref:TonB family protein n=1 Tax=Vitiosangium sp. (strain GDMCC 1.1324) TaxID=2138576 RepID=UPI000D3BE347|nr:TonB family protein [Vitiosangium sp. GDMCC 1.1324]PTL77840.1 energy transducer TonB [Vitiosangium sp. GDMCC 1.1324]